MICFVAHSAKLSYILARSCEALSGGAWARAFQRSEPWAEHAAPGVRAHTDPLTCSSPYAAQKTGLRWRVRDWGARQLELKPAPATQKRYETNNLPCPPPTRKRKAFAKSREVWDMGGRSQFVTSGPGGRASRLFWVSRGCGLLLPFPAGYSRSLWAVLVALTVEFFPCS